MKKNRERGAVLALIVVLCFVIVLIGVGFFFYSKIIGGSKELQHATDSGNLNVAKEVLKHPGVTFADMNEANEFGGLTDPSTGEINLSTFNRLVGKTVLVALNARAEGTDQARINATSLLSMVEGPGGIGSRLMNRLSSHNQIVGFFEALTGGNSTRMLQNGNNTPIQGVMQETDVSYMARAGASNAYILPGQIPSGSGFSLGAPNVVSKTTGGVRRTYLAGYFPLVTGLSAVQPMAVPVRPGEQPHLVSENEFRNNSRSPLSGVLGSLIPPNTFHSAGEASEQNATMSALRMRSSAIVGSLNVDYPVAIPRGVIVIDNTGAMSFNGNIGGGNNVFSNQLMSPNYVEVATLSDGTPVISDSAQALEEIKNFISDHPGDPVPANLSSQIDSPQHPTQAQLQQLANANVSHCDNTNSFAGGDPNCANNLPDIQQLYGTEDPSGNVSANGLMSVEKFKCFILQVRAGFAMDGSGCGTANAPDTCTGLKTYNHTAQYCLPCNFGSTGTLSGLLAQSAGYEVIPRNTRRMIVPRVHLDQQYRIHVSDNMAVSWITDTIAIVPSNLSTQINSEIRSRLRQIKPQASDTEINAVFASPVPFGQISYIYMNSAGNLVLDKNYPSLYPVPALVPGVLPDGNPRTSSSGLFNLNGTIVNVPGVSCEGYPNPWDCPAVPAEGEDQSVWTPSSGYRNLLGVLQFKNCAHGGGNWCCPC